MYIQNTQVTTLIIAVPPYMPPRHSAMTALRQYGILLRVLLAEYRHAWFFHLIRSLLFPVAFIFLVKAIKGTISHDEAIFLLGGNLASALAFSSMEMLILKIGWGRQLHEFDYWAMLPIGKLTLILALLSIGLFFALPCLLGAYLFGCLFLGLPLLSGLTLLPFVPLGALSLAGFAAFLGSYAPSGLATTMTVNFLTIFVGFLSPMLIPFNVLPLPLQILNLLLPLTYIADTFRVALGGHSGMNVLIDVLILLTFALAFLWLVHRKLDWRRR
jgi:ABC-2 type transport system permease protein